MAIPTSTLSRFVRENSRAGTTVKSARLVVLDANDNAIGNATAGDLTDYIAAKGKSVRGARDHTIGIRFVDGAGNDLAMPLDDDDVIGLLR